jgi:predicted DNA-binding transcriptional regulator AlpA
VPDGSQYVNTEAAAEFLGIAPTTLYGYRHRAHLRPPGFPLGVRIGGALRWDLRDLERWLEEQKRLQDNGTRSRSPTATTTTRPTRRAQPRGARKGR